jgi:hypothetical protein
LQVGAASCERCRRGRDSSAGPRRDAVRGAGLWRLVRPGPSGSHDAPGGFL